MDERINRLLNLVNKALGEVKVEINNSLNVIDELHMLKEENVRENAHSRILCKLLNYQTDKDGKKAFPIFEDFVRVIKEKHPEKNEWASIQPMNPIIRTEVICGSSSDDIIGRIDILIEDRSKESNKYAIIIENKANNAGDQERQIERYIDRELNEGFNEDQIFVLYFPREEDGNPDEQSWGNHIDFKEKKYISFAYNTHFLKWFEQVKELDCIANDELTKSGIIQYHDYLCKWLKKEKENDKIRMNTINSSLNVDEKGILAKLSILGEFSYLIKRELNRRHETEGLSSLYNSIRSCLHIELTNHVAGTKLSVYPITTFQGRKVYMGYQFKYQNNNYLLYIGSNNSGLFCSVISKEGLNINTNINNNGLRNLLNRGNTYYIYDSFDNKYDFRPKVDVFLLALNIINTLAE